MISALISKRQKYRKTEIIGNIKYIVRFFLEF